MEKSESEKRFSVLTIRLTMDEHSRITDTAWHQRRSASSLLREAAEEYLCRLYSTKNTSATRQPAISN